MKVLILGASGMIGNSIFRVLSESAEWEVMGAVRSISVAQYFPKKLAGKLFAGYDVEKVDTLLELFTQLKPDVVINCVGLIKNKKGSDEPLQIVPLNATFPHRLAKLCGLMSVRLIHISTDCIFSGKKGSYTEGDHSDAEDLYGASKYLGEVCYPNTITLRTSTIGHELNEAHGLLNWFLSQTEKCMGYRRAVFSGLPTIVLAKIIRDIVIARTDLSGLYHVAAEPINKYELLRLIADIYGKKIEIIPTDEVVVDRSLDATKFKLATGYAAPSWPDLIREMHTDYRARLNKDV